MTYAQQIVKILKDNCLHISIAESCTGGMVASGIVDVSGASEVFEEGYITYSNNAKIKLLNVQKTTLDTYTAVSAETSKEMAYGAAKASNSDIAVSVTGYAGPDNSEAEIPVGTVYIGTHYKGKSMAKHFLFKGDRQQIRRQAVEYAYKLVLERLSKG